MAADTPEATEHYAFCKDRDCAGCLPSDEELRDWHIAALWGEMAQRCIAQTPATKTREGAYAAIVADGDWYREKAAEIRTEAMTVSDPVGRGAAETAATDAALREKLAAIEHERWAHWQRWMHDQCRRVAFPEGGLLIPRELVERWERQIATPYDDLSEQEKASDREQVDRYWPLIEPLFRRVPSPHTDSSGATQPTERQQ